MSEINANHAKCLELSVLGPHRPVDDFLGPVVLLDPAQQLLDFDALLRPFRRNGPCGAYRTMISLWSTAEFPTNRSKFQLAGPYGP